MWKGCSHFYVRRLRVFTDIIAAIHRSVEENTVAFPPAPPQKKKPQIVNPARGGRSSTPGWPLCGAAPLLITLPKVVQLTWKMSWKPFEILGLSYVISFNAA